MESVYCWEEEESGRQRMNCAGVLICWESVFVFDEGGKKIIFIILFNDRKVIFSSLN